VGISPATARANDMDYTPSFSTRRVVARIEAREKATADDMAAIPDYPVKAFQV
jgi:hypothetical protein